jgi:hypothetical protein
MFVRSSFRRDELQAMVMVPKVSDDAVARRVEMG